MAITKDIELTVREALAETLKAVSSIGHIIPAAHYFNGKEDFWATVNTANNTQKEIETTPIEAVWLYPVNFADTAGAADSPRISLSYEMYLFKQYGLERETESEIPGVDVFNEKVLKLHNEFIEAWLGIKGEFQRTANIAGIDGDEWTERKTNPVVQVEDIANQAICEFIPGIIGFAVRLRETVTLREVDC